MGIIRTAIYSAITWGFLTVVMVDPTIALGISIFLGVLIESTQHRSEVNELMKQGYFEASNKYSMITRELLQFDLVRMTGTW